MAIRPQSNGTLDFNNATWQLKYVRRKQLAPGMTPYYNSNPKRTILNPERPDLAANYDNLAETLLDNAIMPYIEGEPGASVDGDPFTPNFRRVYDAATTVAIRKAMGDAETQIKALFNGIQALPPGVIGINYRIEIPFIANAYPRTLKGCSVVITLPIQGPQQRNVSLRVGGLK